MKKAIIWITAVLLVVTLAVAGHFIFERNYLVINFTVYSRSAQALDLSGTPLKNVEKLTKFNALQELDLRDTGLTAEQYEYLHGQLPQCDINWLVPFQGKHLPLDTEAIQVSSLSSEDILLLSYFTDLCTIDAVGCTDYETLIALQQDHPEYKVLYDLTVSGHVLHQDTDTASSADINEISTALTYLPGLHALDATGCTDYDALLALTTQYPNCDITYTVPLAGSVCRTDTTQLQLQNCTAEELTAALPHLKDLTSVTITQPMEDPSGMLALREAYPDVAFTYYFSFLDRTVSNRETVIDISTIPLESVAFIDDAMPHFLCLEKVDMCGCGISNEEMDALNQRYETTKFVWMVDIGKMSVRTDSTYFMPYHYGYGVADHQLDNMKYLTDLICLDFGHMSITKTDFLAFMPHMQYLILADTDIAELTGFENLKELKYLELFKTDVTDFSPLTACEKLEDLNISYTNPPDVTSLCQMKHLKNLWLLGYWRSANMDMLTESLPDTNIVFGGGTSTGKGWRLLPNYYAQRDILGMHYMLPEELPVKPPEEDPEENPGETPGEAPEGTPGETPGEAPEGTPGETPEENPEEVPEEVPEETPKEAPES